MVSRYSNLNKRIKRKKDNSNRVRKIYKSYKTPYYSRTELSNSDMYFITQEGDRLDKLALQFYGDSNLWWYIGKVNHIKTMNLEAGIRIRIPSTKNGAIIT